MYSVRSCDLEETTRPEKAIHSIHAATHTQTHSSWVASFEKNLFEIVHMCVVLGLWNNNRTFSHVEQFQHYFFGGSSIPPTVAYPPYCLLVIFVPYLPCVAISLWIDHSYRIPCQFSPLTSRMNWIHLPRGLLFWIILKDALHKRSRTDCSTLMDYQLEQFCPLAIANGSTQSKCNCTMSFGGSLPLCLSVSLSLSR